MHKNDIYNSSKNVDVFRLLLSDEDFIKTMDDFREKENIYDYEDSNEWIAQKEEEFYKWIKSDEYINEKNKIKNDYESKKINFQERKSLQTELNKKNPLNKISMFCKDVIKKFNLPQNFSMHINNFLFTGDLENPLLGAGVFFEETRQGNKEDEKILSINIYQNPSEEDFDVLKRFIKHRTRNFPKYREIKYLDAKLELESAYNNKKSYRKIGENINNKAIAKDMFEDSNKNKKVVDDVSAIKKMRTKLFHKKSSEKSSGK